MLSPSVETRFGKLRGERLTGCTVWRGIPFARPPVGRLRFLPPQEPKAWDGILEATAFGPSAVQADLPFFGVNEKSEDCLYLNIWSPAAEGPLRPVMVWIHGGAFTIGSGSQELYDGASFAECGNMVVVTINYRLGPFGFLSLGEWGGEEYAASGNCGLLDQLAALRWVQENIHVFGGDPRRVTVAGESAGAISIGNMLAMPEARGLFHQAILESTADLAIPQEKAANVANLLLGSLGLKRKDLSRLLEVPACELLEASRDFPWGSFWPVLDGITITQPPAELLQAGAARGIRILIGSNQDEYQLFSILDSSYNQLGEAEISAKLEETFGPVWPELSKRFAGECLDKDLFNRIMSYYVLIHPTLRISEMLCRHAPLWAYQFGFKHPLLGAGHGFELPFVWNNLSRMPMLSMDTPEGRDLANCMHQGWIAFIQKGSPDTPMLGHWPAFDLKDRAAMVFGATCRVERDPFPDRVVWEELSALEGYPSPIAKPVHLAGIRK